jgi:ribosomal protein S14
VSQQGELEIIRSYRFPHEALIAKSALEAFGVRAWVLDENQIRLRWYMADALGGVKLAVRAADVDGAQEILSGDHSAALAAVPEAQLPASQAERCPRCGAPALEIERARVASRWPKVLLIAVAALFAGGPAPHFTVRATSRCRSCGFSEESSS